MAEKHKKRKPHKIITTRAEDGSYGHEHVHKDAHGREETPVFAGTSRDLDDIHQHMQDHFGGEEEAGEQPAGPEPGEEQEPGK